MNPPYYEGIDRARSGVWRLKERRRKMLEGLIDRGGECAKMPTSIRTQITFEGRLREEKERLEKRLENINAVLEALKNAPEVTNVLEALNKLGY